MNPSKYSTSLSLLAVNFRYVHPASCAGHQRRQLLLRPAQEVLDGHRAVARQVRAWDRAQTVLARDSRAYIPFILLDQEARIG